MTTTEGLRNPDSLRALVGKIGDGCAVLRHGLPDFERGGDSDWDLAVPDADAAQAAMEQSFGPPVASVRRSYVVMNHYRWGGVDFVPCFQVRGITYLEMARFRNGISRAEDGLPRPRLAHEAFLAWMTGVLAGGLFKERYLPLLARAVRDDGGEFKECLVEAFGTRRGDALWRMAVAGNAADACRDQLALQRAAFLTQWSRDALRLLAGIRQFVTTEMKRHARPPMPVIAFLGPDGSGKTTVIKGVEAAVRSIRLKPHLMHWRPHQVAGNPGDGTPVTDPHASPPRGVAASTAKLGMLAVDWWVAWLGPFLHLRSKVGVILCDRYFADLLVDPRRYRYGAPRSWARRAFRWFPAPDRVVFLLADAPTILARKKEVAADELERQLAAYRELASHLGDRAVVLDAARPSQEVIDLAAQVVIDEISRRSAMRRNWR
jgi:thymidylate kinase